MKLHSIEGYRTGPTVGGEVPAGEHRAPLDREDRGTRWWLRVVPRRLAVLRQALGAEAARR